jgi:hypothetical protein
MTVAEMFEQYLFACYPEGAPESVAKKLKHAFFAGAKSIVAVAGEALSPQFPGDKHHIKAMALQLSQVDQETTLFLRNPEPPAEEEKLIEIPTVRLN